MATESTISFDPSQLHLFDQRNIASDSALKASQILQENHEIHHVFFNAMGLHNHIVHQITTDLALGATPEKLEQHYLQNKVYQRPPEGKQDAVLQTLADSAALIKLLGDNSHYSNFLEFFRRAIKKNGYEEVARQYLFADDEVANKMLQRFVTFHPLIHFGCGVEFSQPAIIAEALALTATTSNFVADFLIQSEHKAASTAQPSTKTMVDLLQDIAGDEKVQAETHWGTGLELFANGPIQNASEQMVNYGSQWNVGASTLQEKMAELINVAAFVAGASQRPPKIVKLDFLLIHGLTTCHYLLVLLDQPWISEKTKARLVEYAGRIELVDFTICGSPKLSLIEIQDYVPRKPVPGEDEWPSLIRRALEIQDDGHTVKVIRALIHGQQVCKEYESKDNSVIKGNMWQRIGHMCVDSVEEVKNRWVRLAGFAEAWENFPDRTL